MAPAIIGGLVGAVVCAAVLATIRPWLCGTGRPCGLRDHASSARSVSASSPEPAWRRASRFAELLVASGGAITAIPTGSVAAAGVVVPVDRDADGEPDTFEGEPLLGFDIDDDDVVDGFLRRCSREPDPLVEERVGYLGHRSRL